jgi:hypothetical protein
MKKQIIRPVLSPAAYGPPNPADVPTSRALPPRRLVVRILGLVGAAGLVSANHCMVRQPNRGSNTFLPPQQGHGVR